jgi:hypothetical protein
MGKEVLDSRRAVLFALGAFALLQFAKVNPIVLIVLSGLLGYLSYGRAE